MTRTKANFPSSVDDPETEEQIDNIINCHFQHHTVISIIHKLHNVLGFDKVAVMDKGRLADFGSPRDLLAQEGLFKQFYGSGTIISDSSSGISSV